MPNENGTISYELLTLITTATLIGTLARIFMIQIDYRQYPNYPNAYLIHIVTGALASAIGAFIVPAIVQEQFTAVTFLALGVQHFRDVRKVERESLLDLEGQEYTSRGEAYIDGISKTFESRNYIALIVSLATGITIKIIQSYTNTPTVIEIILSSIVGLLVFYMIKIFTKSHRLEDIATVTEGKIEVKNSTLYVNGMFVSNIMGRDEAKEWFVKDGIAACIEPNHEHYQIPIMNPGQRQAILFEVTRRLGQRKIYSVQDINSGKLIIVVVPVIKSFELLKETILLTPLLETVKKNSKLLNIKKEGK
ncbi:YIEGIA domain-containing protein [Clostridium sp. UBA1652]|uniref:YIEGIA domain-containing protein n=1 Tax=Clostridium sp. UBA1652 TaxID=1946348 RepID=UPI00257CD674|nr:YIEGIA domain-containing protein [Clostridium sp. UBA1652]